MTIIDAILRLLPALAIVGGIFIARMQIAAARRATAITIAKNHYRKILGLLLKHSDIVYRGATEEALALLQEDTPNYRKYRWLFTNMAFAMQELYFSIDLKKQPHWEKTIANFIALFRAFINSETTFSPAIRTTLDPAFLKYMLDVASKQEHPSAHTKLTKA